MNIQFLNYNDHIWRQYLQDDAYLEEGEQDNKKAMSYEKFKGFELLGQKRLCF